MAQYIYPEVFVCVPSGEKGTTSFQTILLVFCKTDASIAPGSRQWIPSQRDRFAPHPTQAFQSCFVSSTVQKWGSRVCLVETNWRGTVGLQTTRLKAATPHMEHAPSGVTTSISDSRGNPRPRTPLTSSVSVTFEFVTTPTDKDAIGH